MKCIAWMTLMAFLLSLPVFGVAQTAPPNQEEQGAAATPQESEVIVEEEVVVTPEQPEATLPETTTAPQQAPLPPLGVARRMPTERPAKGSAACPPRPSPQTCKQVTAKKRVAACPKPKRVAKRRAVSGKVCISRAEYRRLLAAARAGKKLMAAKRTSKQVAAKRTSKQIASAHQQLMASKQAGKRVAMASPSNSKR
jgi:hypothetical protein